MKARLVAIGSFRGIRIPEPILEECEIKEEIELAIVGRQIVLTSGRRQPRDGWRDAAARMVAAGDDTFLIPEAFEDE